MIDHAGIEAAFARHERAAFYLSGGKDSLACLYVMRPYWDRMTVLWMDSGDAPQETRSLMQAIAAEVPRFHRVPGYQAENVATYGMPVDLVPAVCTPWGRVMEPEAPLLQSRYECCNRVLWQPLHEEAKRIGATLLVRGQKTADPIRPNYKTGYKVDVFEVLNPLESWTDEDVFAYLRDNNLPIPRMYEYTGSNIDCRTCTAYTDELTRAAYLRAHEPEAFADYAGRMALIARWVGPKVTAFGEELVRVLE